MIFYVRYMITRKVNGNDKNRDFESKGRLAGGGK